MNRNQLRVLNIETLECFFMPGITCQINEREFKISFYDSRKLNLVTMSLEKFESLARVEIEERLWNLLT